MRLELHCHSTCSDGAHAPEEVARQAADYGVELFCLTDHDTTAGCARAKAVLGDVRVLRGLELSCRHNGRTVHLLMWGVADGPEHLALERFLDQVHASRSERIVAICERLAKLGMELDADAILESTAGSTPGRPDVARALVEAGAVTSMREAFDRFLADDKPAYVEIDSVTLSHGLALGRACGAKMGLAHPHTQRSHVLVEALFREYREQGLEGIEAFYGTVSPTRARPWLRLAEQLDLVVTGGSDFHGGGQLMANRPGIALPDRQAGRLRDWLADVESL